MTPRDPAAEAPLGGAPAGGPPASGDSGTRPQGGAAPATSLWRGRILLILGIVLLGVSLRYAVTGM